MNWFPNGGGGAVHVQEVAQRLTEKYDCSVTVYTKRSQDEGQESEYPYEVDQIRFTDSTIRFINDLVYAVATILYLLRGEYDLIHVHTDAAVFPAKLVRQLSAIPVVFTVHGSNLDFSVTYAGSWIDRVYSSVSRIIFMRFGYDRVISVSQELTQTLLDLGHEVVYIPNGVDTDAMPEPQSFDSKRILYVGRLKPKKNLSDVLIAMEEIQARHPDAELHIVGEGPLKDDLMDMVKEAGLSSSVKMHGYVSSQELRRIYAQAAIFVLPSEWEGHPLVLLEAWASGIPVVGTDVEGIREFITHGETGYVVPLGSPRSIAETVGPLLEDPERIEEMGREALRVAGEDYSWDDVVDRTYDIYRNLLGLEGASTGRLDA